jgi:hypothetical protein
MDLVEEAVGTGEIACSLHIRVDKTAFNVVRSQFTGKSCDFDITEPVVSKTGLKNLSAVAFENKDISGLCVLVRKNIQRPVLMDELGMSESYFRFAGTFDLEPDPAGEILSEISDVYSRLGARQPHRPEALGYPDGR